MSDESGGLAEGTTVRSASFFTPPPVAVIPTVVVVGIAKVVIGKLALFAPAGTSTDAGTLAIAGIPLARAICVSLGTGPVNVTVPVEPEPAVTDAGCKVSADGAWGGVGVRVIVAAAVTPFQVAVSVTAVVVVAAAV